MDAPRPYTIDPGTMRPGLIRRLTALSIIPANVMGAVTMFFYYNYVDPLGGGSAPDALHATLDHRVDAARARPGPESESGRVRRIALEGDRGARRGVGGRGVTPHRAVFSC
ncbi:MAG TPA: hypothetical protein VMS22_15245 [Candidatus Eisenbacteria bacterium]|nr:hypothetical protein [Candidatus Eisenbacteria bacterium]